MCAYRRLLDCVLSLFVGAGNCLDVACAIALWGCSLPANLLRRLMYVTLVEFGTVSYKGRWRRQQCRDAGTDDYFQVGECVCSPSVIKCAEIQTCPPRSVLIN